MKLPHITIEYREEESFAPGRMSGWLIAGFGLHWAWIYLAMMNGPHLFFPGGAGDAGLVAYGVSAATLALILFAYGIFLQHARTLFAGPAQRRRNRTLAAVCMCSGTALLFAVGAPGGAGLAAAVASGVLTGFGSAVILMSFGVSMSVLDIAAVTTSTALSFLVGTLAYLVLFTLNTFLYPAGALVCLTLPFVELVCLNRCSAQLVDNLEFAFSTLAVKTVPFALHVCLPNLVFGVLLGIVRTLAVSGVGGGAQAAAVLLAGVLSAVLILFAMFTQRQSNNFMFRTLLPVVAIFIAVLALLPVVDSVFVTFALFTAYILLEACVWVFCSDISQRFRISAFTVFGFGRGSCAAGAFIGLIATLPAQAGMQLNIDFPTLAALSLAGLVFGTSLLPKNAELRNTLKLGAHCPALAGDEQFFAISDDEFSGVIAGASAAGASAPEADKPSEPDDTAAGINDATEAALDARMQVIEQAEEAQLSVEETEQQRLGRFKRKCATIAETYLLSRKETEVLFLLAKGRNAAAIQEQLFISAGTANTHMRHIYRKLNVHSQQELIALVDEVEIEDWD